MSRTGSIRWVIRDCDKVIKEYAEKIRFAVTYKDYLQKKLKKEEALAKR